jgi:hypothetical protein
MDGKMINFGVLTISDKGSRGERYDGSGAAIQDRVAILGGRVTRYDIVPDEVDIIRRRLIEWADAGDVDVILTTGAQDWLRGTLRRKLLCRFWINWYLASLKRCAWKVSVKPRFLY